MPQEDNALIDAIASNISALRKSNGYTQGQLAEKLHYSDKSVSKWERGEGVPDIAVLVSIARLFNVSLDQLCGLTEIRQEQGSAKKRIIIHALSIGLCVLAAAIAYASVRLAGVHWPNAWLLFVYALPCAAIVSVVFSAMWWRDIWTMISVSVLIWSLALSIALSVSASGANTVYIIAAVMQVMCLLWFRLKAVK